MNNPNLSPKKHAFNILFGQRPITKFKDYFESIEVDLIKSDNFEDIMEGTYDFCKATWSVDGRESERADLEEMTYALQEMLSGRTLQLGLETVNFMFRISGITRIDTHQIVRQRIGVTFSQQCSGDQFWHHQNALVEPSISREGPMFPNPQHGNLLETYIYSTLCAKNTYANLIDKAISIQAARQILPHNLETFIFMNVNLATLLFFHQKRIDDGSQTWAINRIADLMAKRVCERFPELTGVFEKNKSRFKFQKEAAADRKNTFSTGLYKPFPDEFEYHNRDFLYSETKNQMNLACQNPEDYNSIFEPQFYWGFDQITEEQYNYIKEQYDSSNRAVKKFELTNQAIFDMNQDLNKKLEEYIKND